MTKKPLKKSIFDQNVNLNKKRATPLQKMKKFVKKQIFLEVMGMDSN